MRRTAAILVLNYNGKHLLEECLPSVIRAADRAGPGNPVMVVDNASGDGSVDYLRREFPGIRILEMPENQSLFAYNNALRQVEQDYVVLLNNDIAVREDFLPPLLEPFRDPDVFAVGGKIFDWDQRTLSAGRRFGSLRRGMFYHFQGDGDGDEPIPTLFAPCGASSFDREKFQTIGGMDPLFWPFYYDDVDLSYRAWKRGWKVLYQPHSVLYHQVSATIGKMASPATIQLFDRKNNLLFFWKNITDPGPFLLHCLLLLPRAAKALFTLRFHFLQALGMALRQWPAARASRRRCRSQARRSDREVLDLSASPRGTGPG